MPLCARSKPSRIDLPTSPSAPAPSSPSTLQDSRSTQGRRFSSCRTPTPNSSPGPGHAASRRCPARERRALGAVDVLYARAGSAGSRLQPADVERAAADGTFARARWLHLAGFIAGRLDGADLTDALHAANASGASAVASSGDMAGLPERAELDRFLATGGPDTLR